MSLLHRGQQLSTAHRWHAHVGDDERVRLLRQQRERGATMLDSGGPIAAALERLGEPEAHAANIGWGLILDIDRRPHPLIRQHLRRFDLILSIRIELEIRQAGIETALGHELGVGA